MLERSGKRISTLDLFGRHFVLLLGVDGTAWQAAARQAADRLKVPVDIQRIGSEIARNAFVQGLHLVAGISAAVAMATAIVAAILLRHVQTGAEPERQPDLEPAREPR